ncbi:hypothetical protein SAMN05443428_10642 [Caloramator quimbayensis]|uniref:Mpv17 / PMP22 family protein n=1 Tax=Caloramator quimbayensis TaxID=1147123 RepID=A0A1T4X589_9CLOT|nr:hypothetical protein [Caloramator quimbayensis]SKA84607.1 hypothetical protein SAMN05443428_10642 [Caloramator quimbayensis]
MKKHDFIWTGILALVVAFLCVPVTHRLFVDLSKHHPYLMGFIKFFILATMGELLAIRILNGEFKKPVGLLYRAIIWGFIGILIVIVFEIYSSGVLSAMKKGLLPSAINSYFNTFLFAFYTSSLMNLLFAPTFMAFHRITDTFIDMGNGKINQIINIPLKDVIKKIDWDGFIRFVVGKTIPFFWIPAHTITFLMPSEYRVLMAAFLSIALGGILSFAKRRNR